MDLALALLLALSAARPAAAEEEPAPAAPAPRAEVPGPDLGEPAPEAPDEQLERFRKDVFYVVDAFVVRQDGWAVERGTDGLPDAEREERYAVVWDERPRITDDMKKDDTKIVSEEWVVVDGTGRLLTVGQFGVLSGVLADERPRSGGRTWLRGVQRYYDRDEVEALAAERAAWAASRAGLPPSRIEAVRDLVVSELPEPAWSPVPPAPLE